GGGGEDGVGGGEGGGGGGGGGGRGNEEPGRAGADQHARDRRGHAEYELFQAELAGPGGPADPQRGEQCILQAAFGNGRHYADNEPDRCQQRRRQRDHQQRELGHVRQRVSKHS